MDPQTVQTIAATVVGFLSPYLAKSGEEIAKKIGGDIYEKLKGRFAKKPAVQGALTDLEKTPTDEDAQAAVHLQLKKMLAEDEELANELVNLIKKAGETEAGKTVITQIVEGNNAQIIGQVIGDVTIDKR